GMAACMVIYLFIEDELSFDSFHTKKETIYRLCEIQSFPGTNTQKVALNMAGMGPTLTNEFPEVKSFTRFWNWGENLVEYGDKRILIENVAGVDSSFFQIFDYPLVSGDPTTALNQLNNAIISEEVAMKLFNRLDVLDEDFIVDGNNCIVKGIMKDVPENSHLQFDILLSIRIATQERPNFDSEFNRGNFLNTYLELQPNSDVASLSENFPDYMVRMTGNEEIGDVYKLFIQPLEEVHLASMDIEHDYNNHRKFNGTYIDVFIMVAVFIIIIASLNFMNLTTARAGNRAKEVGVRKTIGALKGQLINQFILESILLSFFAFLLAAGILSISLPFLNNLIDRQLAVDTFINPEVIAISLSLTVLLGILAGLYPSLYLSSFKPILVLKGLKIYEKKSIFRSSLVVVQFSLALGMIICTLVVLQQLNFIKSKDIGFTKDHIVLVAMSRESNEKYEELKQALLNESNILGVTGSSQRLGNNLHQWGFKIERDTGIESITPSNFFVDYDFLDVYDIELIQGRTFSKDYATDDGLAFIVNEAFVEEFGIEDPIGQRVGHGWYPNDSLGTIIGVTKNFNFNSLHFEVNTLAMEIHSDWGLSEMSVKINGDNVTEALRDIERVYNQFVSDYPLTYEFLDSQFEELYKSDQQLGSVITIIAVLSIFIGAMGLFGLASISIQRRIKEVGIRKVMGASQSDLLIILSKSFAFMILLSFIIATPLTYVFLTNWLDNFAYRIQINPLIFLVGGIAALVIAISTISYHTIRATNKNPVESLKYE
ncbi:MAG: FtsX-like permease family protein, partial [Bacteroidota bacterium]